jgi:DNA-directed RNA polymerase subunit beta'
MCLGKAKIRYKGSICDRCGVKVTEVRRDRVGHINLVVPIAHLVFPSLQIKLVISLVFHLKFRHDHYYERCNEFKLVLLKIQKVNQFKDRLSTEEEYLNIQTTLLDNQYLIDFDLINCCKMGAANCGFMAY